MIEFKECHRGSTTEDSYTLSVAKFIPGDSGINRQGKNRADPGINRKEIMEMVQESIDRNP